jgi:hypothetical protein
VERTVTRDRPAEAPDLHHRYGAWLRAGAAGDPPRDVALHAAHCPSCRRATAAMDHLLLIDTGRAPLPPSRAVMAPRGAPVGLRVFAGVAAGIVVVAAGAWAGMSAMTPEGIGAGPGDETPDQEVLGGVIGGADATPTPVASDPTVAPASEAASVSPSSSATGSAPTAAPQIPPPPTLPGIQSPAPTPRLTASPRPTRSPSPVPTVAPTPVPTPEPTPTPFGDCLDGIDNDGDLLIDAADPGCILDGNEFSA